MKNLRQIYQALLDNKGHFAVVSNKKNSYDI